MLDVKTLGSMREYLLLVGPECVIKHHNRIMPMYQKLFLLPWCHDAHDEWYVLSLLLLIEDNILGLQLRDIPHILSWIVSEAPILCIMWPPDILHILVSDQVVRGDWELLIFQSRKGGFFTFQVMLMLQCNQHAPPNVIHNCGSCFPLQNALQDILSTRA